MKEVNGALQQDNLLDSAQPTNSSSNAQSFSQSASWQNFPRYSSTQGSSAPISVSTKSTIKKAIVIGSTSAILIGGAISVYSIPYLGEFPASGNFVAWVQVSQICREAQGLSRSGKVDAAIAKYKEALALNPEDDNIYRKMAEVLAFETNQWNEAEKLVRQALLRDDKDAESYALLAYIQYRNGQKVEAKETIRKAFELKPKNPEIQALRGLILVSQGDKSGEQLAEDAFRNNKNNPAIARVLSLLFLNESVDLNRAEELAREAVRLAPNNADFQDNLATVLIAEQKFEGAQEALKTAAKLESNNPFRLSKLGMFLIDQKREKEALPYLQNAVDLDNKNPVRYFELGRALISANQSADAIPVLKKAVELAPDEMAYKQELADAYFYAKNYQMAAKLFEEVVKSAPGNEYAWYGLAWSYEWLGNHTAAKDAFLKCSDLQPKNARYASDLALVNAKLGNFYMSSQWMTYALSLDASQDYIWETVVIVAQAMRTANHGSEADSLIWNALQYKSNSPARVKVENMRYDF